MTDQRRGRPAGLLLNHVAARHFLGRRSQASLASSVGISAAHLSDILAGRKGASDKLVLDLAFELGCPPEILFPELVQFTTVVRHFTAPDGGAAA